jgi:toxin HigB-1
VIHQTPARLPGDQEIEVAILIGFTSGHGAKHTQAVGAALLGEAEDLYPPFRPQCVEGDHVSIVRQFSAAISCRHSSAVPGNRLEALSGDRKGQHSVRIDNQWRICFIWRNGAADSVEIVDSSKLWEFIERLGKRTEADRVNWEKTPEEGMFQASYPQYTVRIYSRRNENFEEDIIIQILDSEGTVIEQNSDVALARLEGLPATIVFNEMDRIYKSARRKAMGVDHALEILMDSLGSDDPDVPF